LVGVVVVLAAADDRRVRGQRSGCVRVGAEPGVERGDKLRGRDDLARLAAFADPMDGGGRAIEAEGADGECADFVGAESGEAETYCYLVALADRTSVFARCDESVERFASVQPSRWVAALNFAVGARVAPSHGAKRVGVGCGDALIRGPVEKRDDCGQAAADAVVREGGISGPPREGVRVEVGWRCRAGVVRESA
jgi:hypothetical protein